MMRVKLHDPNVDAQIILAHSSPLPSWRRHLAGRAQKIQECRMFQSMHKSIRKKE